MALVSQHRTSDEVSQTPHEKQRAASTEGKQTFPPVLEKVLEFLLALL